MYNKSPFPDLAAAVEAVHHRHLAQGEQIQVRYLDKHKEVHSFVAIGEESGHPTFLGHPFEHHHHAPDCVINYEIDGGVVNLKDDKDEYHDVPPHHIHCHDKHHHIHCHDDIHHDPHPHPHHPHPHHPHPHPHHPRFVKDDYDQFSYTEREGMNETPIEFDNDEFDNVRVTDY